MTQQDQQLATRPQVTMSLSDLTTMANHIAASRMFGVDTVDQAMALMLLCQAEGLHPIMALRRYHIIENKPAYRADALQGEFERDGGILWHERNDKECSATFFRSKESMDDAGLKRARQRYRLLKDGKSVADLAMPNELTIVRTMDDALEKHVADVYKDGKWVLKKNWRQSPRQMLHARCLTEGVRAINPGLVAGIYSEDEIHDMVSLSTEDENQRTNGDAMRSAIADREVITERNVREATANATGEVITGPGECNEFGPLVITQDNYKELVSHVGKAQGNMLGKKVGELPRQMIDWMYNKWREGLGPSSSEQDMRLKKAIEFAKENLKAVDTGESASPGSVAVSGVSAASVPADKGSKQAAIEWLKLQIEDMVMTEEQFCQYVSSLAVVANTDNKTASKVMEVAQSGKAATSLDQLSADQLLILSQNWKIIRAAIETLVKPTVLPDAPKKKGGRKRAK